MLLTGRVCSRPQTRQSPAGIPIARFILEHESTQVEADRPRRARLRIGVVAAGVAMAGGAESLAQQALVRVAGFMASAGYRAGEYRLVLHAQRIEILNEPEN